MDFVQYLPPLLRGAGLTLVICVAAGVLGSLIGVVLGTAKASPSWIARAISSLYVNFIRGVPILIILLFTYFALPLMLPALTFSRGFTAVVGLSIYSGAYMAEIIRGGIQAVPKGQSEAAEALGMHYFARLRYVIFPQAMKIAVETIWGGRPITRCRPASPPKMGNWLPNSCPMAWISASWRALYTARMRRMWVA